MKKEEYITYQLLQHNVQQRRQTSSLPRASKLFTQSDDQRFLTYGFNISMEKYVLETATTESPIYRGDPIYRESMVNEKLRNAGSDDNSIILQKKVIQTVSHTTTQPIVVQTIPTSTVQNFQADISNTLQDTAFRERKSQTVQISPQCVRTSQKSSIMRRSIA
ncbi:hypothetical protein WN51_13328 [Melipona quadrifasciata]|uniref:Uncharacterized protein n=1 Tax=Melipona quadrifasciata TaxID=166423 RepID=A0A0N0U5R1_9HYME|nr:hypothetical protein WN51_13328 [Melipona quadrifasciata]